VSKNTFDYVTPFVRGCGKIFIAVFRPYYYRPAPVLFSSHFTTPTEFNMKDINTFIPFAQKACDFLTASPDPYHSVLNNIVKLEGAGYVVLSKRDAFAGKVEAGGKYYYTFNKTTLVAFSIGLKYQPGNGFKIIGGKMIVIA